MYNLIRESIVQPHKLVKYHKKKGWFVFLYILFLTFLLSIGPIVLLIARDNPVFTEESSGCTFDSGELICDNQGVLESNHNMYGFPVYFLDANQQLGEITVGQLDAAFALQENTLFILLPGSQYVAYNISEYETLEDVHSFLVTSMMVSLISFSIIQNLIILIFIILISSLAFLRFRKMIKYRKLFKLVTFAITPLVLVLTIYNLLDFSTLFFFILMFIAYRSVFALQKELYVRSIIKERQQYRQNQNNSINDDNSIDQEDENDTL